MCYKLPITYHHKLWSIMTDKIFTVKTSVVVNAVHLAVVVPGSRNQIKLSCCTLQCMHWYACTCSPQLLSVCRYVKLYGMKFSREDHLTFIHLMYQLVTVPNLEPWLVSKFAQALIILLKWVICHLCCEVLFVPTLWWSITKVYYVVHVQWWIAPGHFHLIISCFLILYCSPKHFLYVSN